MKRHDRGIGLVEVVIGAAIVSASLVGIIQAFSLYVQAGFEGTNRVKATALAEEGIEATRFLRDQGFSSFAALTTGTPYRLSFASNTWQATTSNTFIDGKFDRVVVIDSAYRRTSDQDIVASTSPDTKALDANARKITVTVSWMARAATSSVVLSTYMTDLFDN